MVKKFQCSAFDSKILPQQKHQGRSELNHLEQTGYQKNFLNYNSSKAHSMKFESCKNAQIVQLLIRSKL